MVETIHLGKHQSQVVAVYPDPDAGTCPRPGVTFYRGTNMSPSISLNSQNRYEIKIYGQLDDSWQGLFGEAKIHVEMLEENTPVTTFSDVVMDQAGVVGLIRRLHGLGVVLISIRQVAQTILSSGEIRNVPDDGLMLG